ncbi:UDP-2,3-diacylglucosamine diphosphatase [Vibrio albus]|uniref:UDP-2,3-diacylglucosamine hydrolase n=1 Tax=Vibrio albus TaxID=2200953 RepID=A0A2U3BAW1_9VIBR|nr:UDP-2,3-diacylglucosamine diphosphatase [Vibrio albus]PWI33930.1 UDP-2,3-diacylglucosamine diphosphatase [Vibrio albus]
MTTLFISDLHLTPSRTDITECFIRFMREEAAKADALYVLGDLFEFWIGDDDNSPFSRLIKAEFKTLTGSGVPCYFVHGNRDFLVGKRFAKDTGVTLLDEVSVIDLYGTKAVVLHGDTLCTDDHNYQEYRKKVHQPWLQWVFNRLPLFIKKKIVSKAQQDIGKDKQRKSLDIMDVNQSEVEKVLSDTGTSVMIHGHTHRPYIHKINKIGTQKTRIVLGDWYEQGSVLVWKKDQFNLERRNFDSTSESD